MTCKSCYQLLLSLNPVQPHCVVKFCSNYGDLDWDSTWKTLFFMPLDRKPIDLCWKVARGVSLLIVSVVTLMRLWSICSSTVSWLKVVWIGFNHYSFCSLLWHQLLPCVVFFSVSVVMSCCVFLVSSVIFCPYLSFLSGVKGMAIVFGPNLQVPWVLSLVSRVACPSIYLGVLNVFVLGASAAFFNANGEQMAISVRSLVTVFISLFLSVFRVCLPRSPLCSEFFS